ncbi:hypothetical protein HaLaN_05785 [Haematococcus lacustris]|uniref:Uncharacterized protein n=1 Tax=Haematococcus lacustris TaxID=44745 RepID=A0A699YJQ6_HAELA|nr:hypothetical protein HaLaN_05785 [Haematococcus lacustris]
MACGWWSRGSLVSGPCWLVVPWARCSSCEAAEGDEEGASLPLPGGVAHPQEGGSIGAAPAALPPLKQLHSCLTVTVSPLCAAHLPAGIVDNIIVPRVVTTPDGCRYSNLASWQAVSQSRQASCPSQPHPAPCKQPVAH